jgi:hypothetical protein
MTHRYQDLIFTPAVQAAQEANGSRRAYQRDGLATEADRLTENEIAFLATRDSFYMATAGEGGWPYIQHRGGPQGFVRVIDERTLALADFRGNRQYVSVGNAADNDRVSLFFMDYARRARLKVLARLKVVPLGQDPALEAAVAVPGYKAKMERVLVLTIEAYDWNCPQHITPRYTMDDIAPAIDTLKGRIAELEAEVARLTTAT